MPAPPEDVTSTGNGVSCTTCNSPGKVWEIAGRDKHRHLWFQRRRYDYRSIHTSCDKCFHAYFTIRTEQRREA